MFHFLWSLRMQFTKYFFVGAATVAIDMGVYALATRAFGLWYIAATVVSQTLAVIFNFFMHRYWSFEARDGKTHAQATRYGLLFFWNYCFSIAALWVLVEVVGLHDLLAKIGVVGLIGTYNFFALKFLVFRKGTG